MDDKGKQKAPSAALRVLGMLCYAGEVNRDVAHWEDDAARILGCGDCECWED